MNEKPEVKSSRTQVDNAALNEVVWQKWLDKNKQRDATRGKTPIRLLCIILISILIHMLSGLSVSK